MSIEPHIWIVDVKAAATWYDETLGFEISAWYPDQENATWCQLRRGASSVMLAEPPSPDQLAPNQQHLKVVQERVAGAGAPTSLYLHVPDADALYQRAVDAGAEPIEEIWDAWWGGRQFTVVDPGGNWWTVFQAGD